MKPVYQFKATKLDELDRDQLAELFDMREAVEQLDGPIESGWKARYAKVLGDQITQRALSNGIDPVLVFKKVL